MAISRSSLEKLIINTLVIWCQEAIWRRCVTEKVLMAPPSGKQVPYCMLLLSLNIFCFKLSMSRYVISLDSQVWAGRKFVPAGQRFLLGLDSQVQAVSEVSG